MMRRTRTKGVIRSKIVTFERSAIDSELHLLTNRTDKSPRRRPAPLLTSAWRRPEEKTVLPRVADLLAAAPHAVALEPLLVGQVS